jgi:preprotein translocase subunit SecA
MITNRFARRRRPWKRRISEARKHLLEYDDVNKQQRQMVGQRRQLLEGGAEEHVMEMAGHRRVHRPDCAMKHPDTWDLGTLRNDILTQFGHKIDIKQLAIPIVRK